MKNDSRDHDSQNQDSRDEWTDEALWTAFALGELEGELEVRAAAQVERNPEARAHVERVRTLGADLEAGFLAQSDSVQLEGTSKEADDASASRNGQASSDVLSSDQRARLAQAAAIGAGSATSVGPAPRWFLRTKWLAAAAVLLVGIGSAAWFGSGSLRAPNDGKPILTGEALYEDFGAASSARTTEELSSREAAVLRELQEQGGLGYIMGDPIDAASASQFLRRLEALGYLGEEETGAAASGESGAELTPAMRRTLVRLGYADGDESSASDAAAPRATSEELVRLQELGYLAPSAATSTATPAGPATPGPTASTDPALYLLGRGEATVDGASLDSFGLDFGVEEDVRARRELEFERIPLDSPDLPQTEAGNRESYAAIELHDFVKVAEDPRSTFSIDVDTASYANVRRFLREGRNPPPGAVRIEELINYFAYDYPQPSGDAPFAIVTEVASCPWNARNRLVQVALQGRVVENEERPDCNLVFLLDVSGSMSNADKLPLLQRCMRLLVDHLREHDRVAIVVYAGSSGLVLDSTPCSQRATIIDALERLKAGGSTNGGQGIQLAYQVAGANYLENGINRVILATDGDFNVGVSDDSQLKGLIQEKAKSGVFLSVLGFGTGNLQDSKMEMLADEGNGHYAYIDSVAEGRRVLVEEMGATLETIAKDVKIQLEFNPLEVHAFRQVGYENRALAHHEFNDDRKDAGEIGAGHSVTALYEIVPAGAIGSDDPTVAESELRYQEPGRPSAAARSGELLTVRVRYKQPDGEQSLLLEQSVLTTQIDFWGASENFRFASAVAVFGELLRKSPHLRDEDLSLARRLAHDALGDDPGGWRNEFLELVELAKQIPR